MNALQLEIARAAMQRGWFVYRRPMAPRLERRAAAHHEAGHAVIASVLGLELGESRIGPKGGGHVDFAIPLPFAEHALLNGIAASVAGPFAEMKFTGTLCTMPDHDFALATQCAADLIANFRPEWQRAHGFTIVGSNLTGDVRVLVAEVSAIIAREATRAQLLVNRFRPAIEQVAELLMARREVTAAEVAEIAPAA